MHLRPAPLIFSIIVAAHAHAAPQEQVAKLTHLMGSAQIFTQPSKKPHGGKKVDDGSMALYENEYYLVREAKVGDAVEQGNVVRTHPSARARVIYSNGDQIVVGPGSAYRVHWDEKTGANPKVDLIYGKIRGVVSKEGPRNKFTLRTKTATMGVRGTDFFIAERMDGETEITVVRGAVEVTPAVEGAKSVEVTTGNTATVTARGGPLPATKEGAAAPAAPLVIDPTVAIRETTKQDYKGIEKSSEVASVKQPAAPNVPASVAQEIRELEKKAIQVTLKDIQTHQPELHARLASQASSVRSAQELNSKAVQELSKTAPAAPPKRKKPTATEMDKLEEENAYKKFFRIQD